MPRNLNIFQKIVIMILLLLTPIMAVYYYSSTKSLEIVRSELIKASLNKMEVFTVQMETSIEKFELVSTPLLVDTNIQEYLHNFSLSDYTMLKTRSLIQEKLSLASVSSNWRNNVTVYLPHNRVAVSSFNNLRVDPEELIAHYSPAWQYGENPFTGKGFTRYFLNTADDPQRPETADLILAISLSEWDFKDLLDTYKSGDAGDPFFYRDGKPIIASRDADPASLELVSEWTSALPLTDKSGHFIHDMADTSYLISYYRSDLLGCYLVDYFPLDRVIAPILDQRLLFGLTSALILLTGITAAFMLYRNVQIPIFQLIRGVQRVKRGDYSYRIARNPRNEFSFLMQNFNEMSAQIEHLVENELKSRIQARDATLKQLQAQIHPHFLYNCLGFVINMSKLGHNRAVIDMSYNLADYYRYSTRMDNQWVTLKEEMEFVVNFLEIHRLRIDTLTYSVELPEACGRVGMPRFIVQPIVENALVHGLENVEHPGRVEIRAVLAEGCVQLVVEDNGKGMTQEEIAAVQASLDISADAYAGCGLWNVYQRLVRRFGGEAYLRLERSPLGGMKVSVGWPVREGEDAHV